ncbi:MAG: purine-binding chemotaxis protein CheW [Firmicutes bacterium]|nr:purine-binding chemotaxis protein CheW [Bacillota bacterium]
MSLKILTFYLNGYQLGVDITSVKEINRNISYTPVPDAPPHIVGLLNLRGQVVTLFDLAGLLGLARTGTKQGHYCIILKTIPGNSSYAGFLFDEPGSVIDVTDEISEPPPANLNHPENNYIERVVKVNGEVIMVIDSKFVIS